MKKVFPLQQPGRDDARVVEAVKNEVRKYLKRERRKKLPEGFDEWTFACRVGQNLDSAQACTVDGLVTGIDAAVGAGATEVYVEILAQPGHRNRPVPQTES